jgi:hypothetical protein
MRAWCTCLFLVLGSSTNATKLLSLHEQLFVITKFTFLSKTKRTHQNQLYYKALERCRKLQKHGKPATVFHRIFADITNILDVSLYLAAAASQ